MPAYLMSRLFMAAWVIFGVISLVFFLIHWVPGDPIEVMLGESASGADREALRHALGLDRPVLEQWLAFLSGVLSLDLGDSLYHRQPVADLLHARYAATAELAVIAFVIAVLIAAVPIGITAAARQGSAWDYSAMGFSLLGVSIPNFWLGPLLVLVFSLALGWFPVSGRSGVASVVLPAITLGMSLAAVLSRMVRSVARAPT